MWSAHELKCYISILELVAVKLAIPTFTKNRDVKAIHLQVDNIVTLTLYSKSENFRGSQENLGIPFEVGDHNYCRIRPKRVEYNSRLGNSKQFRLLRADAEASNFSASLPNNKCSRGRFACIPSITSDTNLRCTESRSSQSCNRCISTELDTQSPVCFFPFCMIPKILNKTLKEKVPKLVSITPAWKTKLWYAKILSMSIKSPILLPWRKDLLKNTKGEIHALVQNRILQLVVWTVSGIDCRRREFQRQLPTLPPSQEDQILMQIMKQPGESELAGVLEGKLIHFLVM